MDDEEITQVRVAVDVVIVPLKNRYNCEPS